MPSTPAAAPAEAVGDTVGPAVDDSFDDRQPAVAEAGTAALGRAAGRRSRPVVVLGMTIPLEKSVPYGWSGQRGRKFPRVR